MAAVAARFWRSVGLSTLLGACAALVGAGIGARRLDDNSFLTHLATGRLMLEDGIVRTDAFTWTSAGEPLVVQSWLASLAYAVVEDLGGLGGVRLLMGLTAAGLAAVVWALTGQARSLSSRLLVLMPSLWIGLRVWNERPLLLGLLCLAGILWWSERGGSPRMHGVVGAFWINVHGSWPLGLVLLVGRWLGSRADDDGSQSKCDRGNLGWLVGGMAAGGFLNPYGPNLLWFPFRLLAERNTLRHVSEWKASDFASPWTQLFLILVGVAMLVSRRVGLRLVVPAVVFVIAALLSARNIAPAVIVMTPLLASGMPELPSPPPERTSGAIRAAFGAVVVAMVIIVSAVPGPHTDLRRYPVAAIDAMESDGRSPVGGRAVHQDFVGNYLGFRFGPVGAAWIDDRVELHDASLIEDYLLLLRGGPGWDEVIGQIDPDVVLWERDRVLVELLLAAGWTVDWSDDDWMVLVPG